MSDKLRQELHERLDHVEEFGKPLLNRVGPDYIDPLVQVIWECIQDRAEDKEAWRQRLSMAMDGWEKADKDNQALRARVAELEAEVEKLQAFKDYTHKRMDELGVPQEVPSPHTDAGCRIGGRFDWVSDHLE